MCGELKTTSASRGSDLWLPPGIELLSSHGEPETPKLPPRCRSLISRQFERVGSENIAVVASVGSSSIAQLLPSATTQFDPLQLANVDEAMVGGFDGCLVAGALEMAEHPSALLAASRRLLRPGGLLAVVVEAIGRRPSLRQSARSRAGQRYRFPGETLAALLFRNGFERPEFYRCSGSLVVTAVRGEREMPWLRQQKLSVVLPVFNERSTFKKTMELVLDKEIPGLDIEVIVIESNSNDGTREDVLEYADEPRVNLILEDAPRGKGHAVRRGLAAADGDFILIQDADLEYDIDDYERLLEPLREGQVGFVLGMRTSSHGRWGLRDFGGNDRLSLLMNVGHVIFLALFNVVYGQRLKDPFTMYKLFRRDCLHGLTFECNRFDFDWELTGKLIRAGYRPRELPVTYRSRSFADGKKVRVLRDPLGWIWACLRCRVSKLYSYT